MVEPGPIDLYAGGGGGLGGGEVIEGPHALIGFGRCADQSQRGGQENRTEGAARRSGTLSGSKAAYKTDEMNLFIQIGSKQADRNRLWRL